MCGHIFLADILGKPGQIQVPALGDGGLDELQVRIRTLAQCPERYRVRPSLIHKPHEPHKKSKK